MRRSDATAGMGEGASQPPRYIFKYQLNEAHGGQHHIPADSWFLDLQVQNGVPTMWWSVPADSGEPSRWWPLRTFTIAPTGPPGHVGSLHYVGTFQLGEYVGHVLSHEPIPRPA